MKLINDFFKELDILVNESGFITTIELSPAHIVYSGHFPGYPVTPGVIQLQIVHELLEKYFSRALKLISMPQCKFLKILDPNSTSKLVITIEFIKTNETISVKASGENGAAIFFKLNAVYQFV